MKLRHAVALIIWYLFIPPTGGNEHSPLSQWQIANAFDTEAQCQAGRKKYYADGTALIRDAHAQPTIEEGQRFRNATCVAADDPRLSGY